MKTISYEEQQKIVNALYGKGVNLPCPRCNGEEFSLSEGYFVQKIYQQEMINELVKLASSKTYLPSVVIVCNNCGYISQHALGILGLLPPE